MHAATRLPLSLVCAAALLLPGAGSAGGVGTWTRVTLPTLSNTGTIGLVRSRGGLQLVWLQKNGTKTDLVHSSITASGGLGPVGKGRRRVGARLDSRRDARDRLDRHLRVLHSQGPRCEHSQREGAGGHAAPTRPRSPPTARRAMSMRRGTRTPGAATGSTSVRFCPHSGATTSCPVPPRPTGPRRSRPRSLSRSSAVTVPPASAPVHGVRIAISGVRLPPRAPGPRVERPPSRSRPPSRPGGDLVDLDVDLRSTPSSATLFGPRCPLRQPAGDPGAPLTRWRFELWLLLLLLLIIAIGGGIVVSKFLFLLLLAVLLVAVFAGVGRSTA